MRWPFTTYGSGTLALGTVVCLGLAGLALWQAPPWAALPLAVWLFMLSFFRDPDRSAAGGEDELVAPADGLVTDVVEVEDEKLGKATRVGIFLSVFNVHVNRVPCAGTVEGVDRREGRCLDARDRRATDENRAVTLRLRRPNGRRLAVRQITGLIARRIICPVDEGADFARGERYGMIRFGSRTELLVPTGDVDDVLVKAGDQVKGGETLILRTRS